MDTQLVFGESYIPCILLQFFPWHLCPSHNLFVFFFLSSPTRIELPKSRTSFVLLTAVSQLPVTKSDLNKYFLNELMFKKAAIAMSR